LDIAADGVEVNGDQGVLWGRFALAFTFESNGRQRSLRNAGTYLMVLRRTADDEWRITHRLWDDPVARAD
jgi:ketosteroid isomerase-like protein